jgi:6,7-dimethyl-8-ribityllumazine synthase
MARYDKIYEYESNLNGQGLRVGVVMSRFNLDVCEGLLSACTASLLKHGVAATDIKIATVAGALEIPLVLKKMAESGKFDALVALGAVIRGETYHFEIVSNEMASGITRVNLDTGVPIANGVLTTNTDHQATERMSEKGREAATTVIEMANLLKAI